MIVIKELIEIWGQFTINIKDRMIDHWIKQAEDNHVKPVLGDNLYIDIRKISDTTPTEWNNAIPYQIGSFSYELNEGVASVYKAIQTTTNEPLSDINYWQPSPLGNFWYNYVLPWAVFETLIIFSAFHGVNFTQSGVRVNSSTTDFPADGSIRAAITSNYKNNAVVKRKLVENFLCEVGWTIDNVNYTTNCEDYKRSNPGTGVRAAGKKTYRKYGRVR